MELYSRYFFIIFQLVFAYFYFIYLSYRYRNGPRFYNWVPVFLEKAQAASNYHHKPKFYYSLTLCFFLWSFCSFCHFSHMSFPYLLGDGLIFFWIFVCAALELLLWLKSKNHKGNVSLPTLLKNYQNPLMFV